MCLTLIYPKTDEQIESYNSLTVALHSLSNQRILSFKQCFFNIAVSRNYLNLALHFASHFALHFSLHFALHFALHLALHLALH